MRTEETSVHFKSCDTKVTCSSGGRLFKHEERRAKNLVVFQQETIDGKITLTPPK